MSLRHQLIPNEPAAQTSKPAKKPTIKPVEKIATHSTASERIEPPLRVSSRANALASHVSCPTCGRPLPKSDKRSVYQRELMRERRAADRARQKAQE